MISFIAALYNEEDEIHSLISHIYPYVDGIYLADDGSTDLTPKILNTLHEMEIYDERKIPYQVKFLEHIGLPETVKNEALKMVPDNSWVIMLDADERFKTPLSEIIAWVKSPASEEVDYVYFQQYEIIDGKHVRTFQKCKLFRKESITFSTGIHEDDRFEGRGEYYGWEVYHRKTTYKQILREEQYVETYRKLLEDGKIDEGRYQWLLGLHHYIKG